MEEPARSKDVIESAVIESHPKPSLRRFSRVPHQSDRYYGFLVWNDNLIELDENNEDPITYVDVLQRSDLEP